MSSDTGKAMLIDYIDNLPEDCLILLWSGIPCTGGSNWVRVNLKQYKSFRERLATHHVLWEKLFINFEMAAERVLKRNGHIALEWPKGNSYWSHRRVKGFFKRATNTYGAKWTQTYVDGPAVGLIARGGKDDGKHCERHGRL